MDKKMVYVVVEHDKDLDDGSVETHILGVAPTIEKANEYIKSYSGFYGRITSDTLKNDSIGIGRLARIVTVSGGVDNHAWKYVISAYGRYMIE